MCEGHLAGMGFYLEVLHLTRMLFLFLSHSYPSPRYTIYLLMVLCSLLYLRGIHVLFFFLCRVSSQMKKLKVLKDLRMNYLKQKVMPWPHAWCFYQCSESSSSWVFGQ